MHMRGRQASSQRFQGHAHASKQGICVEEEFKPGLSYEHPRIGVEVLRIGVGNIVKQGRI
ncbi:hypothetical protein PIB30_100558, partial [Stylosanthes scabra]|nr:hypothetical protein [Stylosanthes scabra]